ncbi:MAG: maltotransferase domain-containing protein, partial [Candidatus Nanopelagicales bacterium]
MPQRSSARTRGAHSRGSHTASVPADGLTSRIAIVDVWPQVQCGRRPAAAATGETLPVQATIFRDGHAPLSVEVVLQPPQEAPARAVRMEPSWGAIDRWTAPITVDAEGLWTFTIHAWSDPWLHWLDRAR